MKQTEATRNMLRGLASLGVRMSHVGDAHSAEVKVAADEYVTPLWAARVLASDLRRLAEQIDAACADAQRIDDEIGRAEHNAHVAAIAEGRTYAEAATLAKLARRAAELSS